MLFVFEMIYGTILVFPLVFIVLTLFCWIYLIFSCVFIRFHVMLYYSFKKYIMFRVKDVKDSDLGSKRNVYVTLSSSTCEFFSVLKYIFHILNSS